jgi:hypothetical protein
MVSTMHPTFFSIRCGRAGQERSLHSRNACPSPADDCQVFFTFHGDVASNLAARRATGGRSWI